MDTLQQVKIDTLKEGMIFSAPLFFDDGKNMFLPKGHAISEYHMSVLSRWKIPFILTCGHLVTSNESDAEPVDLEVIAELDEVEELSDADEVEELEDLDEVDYPVPVAEQKKKSENYDELYNATVEKIASVFNSYRKKIPVSRSDVDEISEDVFNMVEKEQTLAMAYIMNKGCNDGYASSALNIAIISATVAFHMQIPRQRILMLITAALLHDIGMMQIPESVVNKKNMLTSQEFEQLKLHTLYSERFVSDTLLFPREVSNIVMQHHERWDGSGYPNGRKGKEIDTGARILAVADTFEALLGKKPYHDAIISYEAMKTLLAESGTHFDSEVMTAFVQTMGVYPVGSIVQLSDGSVAKVIEASLDAPFQPVVKLQGENAPVIRLQQQKALFIVRVVAPK
ncbi:MAG: HD-GYP domain-containing protein [Treponema sp.]|nr:HD-GYP domain-containing protein [Candidatus Treponema caballi]